VSRARTALAGAGEDPAKLDGYTWHVNRHTWASRLTMAGVDPRTIMALDGWSNMAMLARYSHLTPGPPGRGGEAGADAGHPGGTNTELTSGRGWGRPRP